MNTKATGDLSPTNFEERGGKKNLNMKNPSKLVGDKGEKLACEYLVEKGYKILGRNYRINFGEVDIIAKKRWKLFTYVDKTVHFIEVKTLKNSQENIYPEQRVDYKKQRKLRQLAEIWLQKNKYPQNYPYQIDIVSVITEPETKIDFFENVVSEFDKHN